MTEQDYDDSASGYIMEAFEGLSRTFTDVETLRVSEVNIVAKGKRYGRWWLLKGLRQEVAAEAGYRQRLRKELEILMLLQHPNIVSAVGIETVSGLGECIVMEFVDGMTLKEWLQGTTTRQQRRKVARELTEAVGYVHTKGVVHRDLKPENILITANGENVKLVDFGLADTDSHAILKQPAGTPHYMSPEQMQTAVADVRNDIYSLGILFGEMQLGYGRIVKKCLLSLERRYQNVAALQTAILAHDRRRTRNASIAIVLFVLLLAGLVGVQTMRLHNFDAQAAGNRAEQEQLKNTVSLLSDSLARVSARHRQLADEQEQQRMKRQRVEDAVSRGKEAIDKSIKRSGIKQYLDTLSSYAYIDKAAYLSMSGNMFKGLMPYLEQIKSAGYTEEELGEITNRITIYQSEQYKHYYRRFEQMKADYDRKVMQGN